MCHNQTVLDSLNLLVLVSIPLKIVHQSPNSDKTFEGGGGVEPAGSMAPKIYKVKKIKDFTASLKTSQLAILNITSIL